jgi:hypothetical protein
MSAMLKRIISLLLIAAALGASIFPATSYACSSSDRMDCTVPAPDPPK